MKLRERDITKCLACSINIEHDQEQHDNYVAIYCNEHHSWCGDHKEKNIYLQLEKAKSKSKTAAPKKQDSSKTTHK
jgi:hypothetical protein